MGLGYPMLSMSRCASASLELRCRLPANLLVAAFGCSHLGRLRVRVRVRVRLWLRLRLRLRL